MTNVGRPRLPHGYVRPEPTHWFWNEDVPAGKGSLSIEECMGLAITPHENRISYNDIPAVLFSATYYLLDTAEVRSATT